MNAHTPRGHALFLQVSVPSLLALHVITCRWYLFCLIAPELIHEPKNSRLSTVLSRNSAAQVVRKKGVV